MLNAETTARIVACVAQHDNSRDAAIVALLEIQRVHGWISDEHLGEAAWLLATTVDELELVATFYPLLFRRPVGRHVVLVCDSVACWIRGRSAVCRRLRERLGVPFGGTTSDNRFTLLPIVCLGACDHAPALMIDDELHGDVAPEGIDGLLAKYR